MLNEIQIIVGGTIAAVLSGLAGLAISAYAMRRTQSQQRRTFGDHAWEHHSAELARNLLVLETVGDELESSPIDVAVRARLTPAEMQQATEELEAAGLVDKPTPSVVRLTSVGRSILAAHRIELEESSIHRGQQESLLPHKRSVEELDRAIDNAVAVLRTQHAHS